MSNSFKHLQNKLERLRTELEPDEPNRRVEALQYINTMMQLARVSYHEESVADYSFLQSLLLASEEADYFGGFTSLVKKSLHVLEKRYNYIYEEGDTNIK